MRQAGIAPADGRVIADGKNHRYRVEGDKPGRLNGEYALHLDGRPAGFFRSYKAGIRQTWKAGSDSLPHLSDDEREALAEQAAERQRQAEADRIERQERMAERAAAKAAQYGPAPDDHPYLVRKGVKAHGAALTPWNELFLPLRDIGGKVWSFQTIAEDGAKLFLAGARKAGTFYLIGEIGAELVIAEGFATAASIREATGLPVVVALDAGNLLPVAEALRQRHPAARIVIAADDDHATAGNPGLTKANAAAEAIGAVVAVPVFADETTRGTDFNDLATAEELEAVARIVRGVLDLSPEPAPELPPLVELTADEAAAEVEQALEAIVLDIKAGRAPDKVQVFKVTAGVGKTTAVLRVMQRHPDFLVELAVSSDKLAAEVRKKAREEFRISAGWLRGRGAVIDPETGARMCAVYDDDMERGAKLGLSIRESRCVKHLPGGGKEVCKFYAECGAVNQHRAGGHLQPGDTPLGNLEQFTHPQLLIYSHAYLGVPQHTRELIFPDQPRPAPQLLIVDEDPTKTFERGLPGLDDIRMSLAADRLTADRQDDIYNPGDPEKANAERDLVFTVNSKLHAAMREGRDPRKDLRVEDVAEVERIEREAFWRKAPDITPAMDDKALASAMRKLAKLRENALRRDLWRVLREDMERPELPMQRIVYLPDIRQPDGTLRDHIGVAWRAPLTHAEIPTVVLDATANSARLGAIWPEHEVRTIHAARNAEVFQVTDMTCSRLHLMGPDARATPRDLKRAAGARAAVLALARREAAKGRRVLIVTYKCVAACPDFIPPPGVGVATLGDIRGRDEWREFDCVIIAGRLQPSPAAIEHKARAMFGDRKALQLGITKYAKVRRRYRTRDGSVVAVEIDEHPDPDCQALLEASREDEIEQALDRPRGVRRQGQPLRIINLCKVPLRDVRVDHLLTADELLPCRLEQTAMDLVGWLPLAASELHRLDPARWVSQKAAELELGRRKAVQAPQKLIGRYSLGSEGFETRRALIAYRRPGQRGGHPFRVLAPGWLADDADLAAELERAGFGPVASAWRVAAVVPAEDPQTWASSSPVAAEDVQESISSTEPEGVPVGTPSSAPLRPPARVVATFDGTSYPVRQSPPVEPIASASPPPVIGSPRWAMATLVALLRPDGSTAHIWTEGSLTDLDVAAAKLRRAGHHGTPLAFVRRIDPWTSPPAPCEGVQPGEAAA